MMVSAKAAAEAPPAVIYEEFLARTAATNGSFVVTYTAVGDAGSSDVTNRYLSEYSPDRVAIRIGLEEAQHIPPDRRATLAEEYGDSAETRLEGMPQLGSGSVFNREHLQAHWAKHIIGMDFGIAHPFAAVHIAWVPDLGDLYVVNSFRVSGATPLVHVNRIHQMTSGMRVKCVWPHDGHVRDKGSGLPLIQQYNHYGLNVADKHALNYGSKNYSTEPGLQEMREFMESGKLHIAPHNMELIEELKGLHRDNNHVLVRVRDDMASALRLAIMEHRAGKRWDEYEAVG
jgi:phage terminase large subunit-like protein